MQPENVLEKNAERQRVLTAAVVRAADILGLNQATLGKVLGLSAATVSRMHNGQYELDPKHKEWELAALLVRLYRGLDAISAGDEKTLRAWMANDNLALRAKPFTLIDNITGLVKTVDYVDAHRARI